LGPVHWWTLVGIGVGAYLGAISIGWVQVAAETHAIAYIAATLLVFVTTVFPVLVALQVTTSITGLRGGFLNGLGMGIALLLLLAALQAGTPILGY
jgi:hypothetical protein